MKWKKNFYPTDIFHIYQRSVDEGVIFYSIKDFLIFYSIINYYAKKYDVKMPALCLMINHFHTLIMAGSLDIIRKFIQATTSVYARMFNSHYGRNGALFAPSFGMANKFGEKSIRTAISYLYNNPVEKNLVQNAEDYRWNFLGYIISSNPFSKPIIKRKCRTALRQALKMIDEYMSTGKYLNYGILHQVYKKLDHDESEQMTDHIIKSYTNLDYNLELSYYKDYDNLLLAINSNTGSEYDISENRDQYTNFPFQEIAEKLLESGFKLNSDIFHTRTQEETIALANWLLENTSADIFHIKRFFHI